MKLTEKATWCQPIGRASQAVWEQSEEAVAILCTKCHSSPQQARKRKCVKWTKKSLATSILWKCWQTTSGMLIQRSEILSAVLEPFYPIYLLALMCYPRFNKMIQNAAKKSFGTNCQVTAAMARSCTSSYQFAGLGRQKKKMKRQGPFANLLRMNIEWKFKHFDFVSDQLRSSFRSRLPMRFM